MTMDAESVRLLLPRQVRELPADLAAVVILTLLTVGSVVLPVVRTTPLRIGFGLVFVLFLPGYALVAALFPEAGEGPEAAASTDGGDDPAAEARRRGEGIDGIERVALSFGLSIAVVPLVGLVLNFTPWGIRLVPILLSISGLTLVLTAVAARRRWQLPPSERFAVPYRTWYAAGRAELLEPDSRADAALNVLLVVSVLLAAGSVGYAVAVPKQGESFTEFYLLTQRDNGTLVAADYPTEFERGEGRQVVVGIGNHEHERVGYTVVVELQRVRFGTNSTTASDTTRSSGAPNVTNLTVVEQSQLGRLSTVLAANETWHRPYTIQPTMTGDRLRLAFLLYRDEVPPRQTVDNAYRELHLWVNVSRA